jgi:diaminopropionate ammonia-lyase
LNAFKAIGASYAVYRFLRAEWEKRIDEPFESERFFSSGIQARLGQYTFTAATDGNHGRSVAWVAKQLGQKAVIYVPQNMVAARKQAIESEGAEVIVVDGHYDQTVQKMASDAKQNGRQIISDTAWPGYEEIPRWIMTGYTTIFHEIDEKLHDRSQPDFVFVQAGVGGLAAAAADYSVQKHGASRPHFICVEPLDADCLLESIVSGDGEMAHAKGTQNSIMSGLNCGTPSSLAWPVIKQAICHFLAIDDSWACEAMRLLYDPLPRDRRVISGESGAGGLAGLLAVLRDNGLKDAKNELGINEKSTILVINTEGDTDPVNFERIVSHSLKLAQVA